MLKTESFISILTLADKDDFISSAEDFWPNILD